MIIDRRTMEITNEKEHGYLVTSRTEILQVLKESKLRGSMVGVMAASVREGMFLCAVREISRDEDEGDFLVVLHQNVLFPVNGDGLTLYLSEITALCII